MIYRKVNTNLSETLDEIGLQKAKRDDYAKCILADPQVLARIAKNVVTEFEQMSVENYSLYWGADSYIERAGTSQCEKFKHRNRRY